MPFYNNLFASAFNFYSRFKNESPRVTAILIIYVSQVTTFLLIISLIGKTANKNLFLVLPNKYFALPLLVIWLLLLFKHFTEEKIVQALNSYNSLPKNVKHLWSIGLVVHFIFPTIIIFIILSSGGPY